MKYPDITFGRVEAVWNKLGGEDGVQRFLAGHAEIVVKKHVIDLGAEPFVAVGWKVEEHVKHDDTNQFEWDASKVQFHLDKGQENGKRIEGDKLRKALAGKPVLNANVLDYLLKHPHLIPEDWKKGETGKTRYICFWGTIYRYADGYLYIRCLCWYGGRWDWQARRLSYNWYGDGPAALRAS